MDFMYMICIGKIGTIEDVIFSAECISRWNKICGANLDQR